MTFDYPSRCRPLPHVLRIHERARRRQQGRGRRQNAQAADRWVLR
jgi:hypothetical protein